jgi:hypothetical protein
MPMGVGATSPAQASGERKYQIAPEHIYTKMIDMQKGIKFQGQKSYSRYKP